MILNNVRNKSLYLRVSGRSDRSIRSTYRDCDQCACVHLWCIILYKYTYLRCVPHSMICLLPFNAAHSWSSASMLVPKGLGCCLSLLQLCTLLHGITSTPIIASPVLQLTQPPLPTYTAALGKCPPLVSNESYGTMLPSNITNLTSGDWPDPPFWVTIPGFGSACRLQFSQTRSEGAFLQRAVLLDIINKKVLQWRREQSTYTRPAGFSLAEFNVRLQMRPIRPRRGGDWLSYTLAIAALTEFGGLVSEWGAIVIPCFTVSCDMEDKAVLEVGFL